MLCPSLQSSLESVIAFGGHLCIVLYEESVGFRWSIEYLPHFGPLHSLPEYSVVTFSVQLMPAGVVNIYNPGML